MITTLEYCPFCGKSETLSIVTGQEFMDDDQEFWQHSESFAVVCDAAKPNGKGGCGGMGGFGGTEEDAVTNWNKRSND